MPEKTLREATKIEVHLYGSLSATGKGHGTDRAVLGGLLGWEPKTCNEEALINLFSKHDERYQISIRDIHIPFTINDIFFDEIHHSFPYSNTMIFRLMKNDTIQLEKEYYSLGGGFLICKGESGPVHGKPLYEYSTMNELKEVLETHHISFKELMIKNEEAISKRSEDEIYAELIEILHTMERSVERGLNAHGLLPGSIGLERKAFTLFHLAESQLLDMPDKFLVYLDAYALAVAEENAAGHKVVTAPTSGAAGVIPAIIYLLKHHFHTSEKQLAEALLAAAAIGFLAKKNASISGAEVGCQGEVGVASAMAAALVSFADGRSIQVIENAAEIALEHQLGLTCDPIGGYVQIPCIERNAAGAVNAYNAYILASSGDPSKQKISFDAVVQVMWETGRDMCSKYKETSKGGLATCKIFC